MKKNIAVIFGGISSEHFVSLQSAAAVLDNFPDKYNAVPVLITKRGEWVHFTGNTEQIRKNEFIGHYKNAVLALDRGANCLTADKLKISIDAAFPIMHGIGGEDGTLQGLLELAGIPVCGCGVLASAICMDKHRAHKLAQSAGIKTPYGVTFKNTSRIEPEIIKRQLGFPVFVKPVKNGSSFGISRVADTDELMKAVRNAFEFDDEIIIEQEIMGSEVGCAIVGNDDLVVGEIDQIRLTSGFFDYTEKYTLKTSEILCPAPILPSAANAVKETAKTIYKTLGCKGFARVDMFLSADGEIIFNEVNTIPGFTEHSRFPSMMKAAGYSITRVIEMIIEQAVNGNG